MTTTRLLACLLVPMVLTVAVVRTRSGTHAEAATTAHAVVGVVTAAPADGRVMVSHEEIPGYMAAMTMPFAIDPASPPSLRPGDRVRFTLRVGADWSRAERFEVIGHDAAIAAALRGPAASSAGRLRRGDAVPQFSLTTESGQPFTAVDLQGQMTVATFIFTRCPVPEFCPLMSKRLQQLQRETSRDPDLRDVRFLSISLDPTFDTPTVLAAYAQAMGAEPARWRFVTGAEAEIARLTKAFAVHTDRGGILIEHTLATAAIGRDGRIVDIWRGNGWKAAEVLTALRQATALPAAGAGAAGSRSGTLRQ